VNHHLLRDLTERDLWDDKMKNQLIAANGSIQVPDFAILKLYSLKHLAKMFAFFSSHYC
jgi:hypothetical protein